MSTDPYSRGLVVSGAYTAKRPLTGEIVAVMDMRISGRDLHLETYRTRAFSAGEVCELILTDQTEKGPGDLIPDAVYLGFAEITRSSLMIVGDALILDGEPLGTVLGFDSTHLPNHYNVLIGTTDLRTGEERRLAVETPLQFVHSDPR